MPVEGRSLSARRTQQVARNLKIGQPINSPKCSNCRWRCTRKRRLKPPVGYRYYLEAMHDGRPVPDAGQDAFDAWVHAVLQAYGSFQLMCAVRAGPHGVEEMNRHVEQLLAE